MLPSNRKHFDGYSHHFSSLFSKKQPRPKIEPRQKLGTKGGARTLTSLRMLDLVTLHQV